jgi:glycosyltransferase involved in cell wall biosynthesis
MNSFSELQRAPNLTIDSADPDGQRRTVHRAATMLAKIHFGKIEIPGHHVVHIEQLSIKVALREKNLEAIFIANPTTLELAKVYLIKRFFKRRLVTSVFDLILRKPQGLTDRLLARVKGEIFKAIDQFILIHRAWSGYERFYGIPPSKCRYVPFKANNLRLTESIDSIDGEYVVSCGASHRDYNTLLKAITPLGYHTVIVVSSRNAALHNANLDSSLVGPNVEIKGNVKSATEFNQILARSRLVVIPIIEGTLQPAGISVCLEAMALGKPVIITRGTSTEGILNDQMARIVPAGDVKRLREAISSLWSDSSKRMALGAEGRKFAQSLGGDGRLVTDITRQLTELCNVR